MPPKESQYPQDWRDIAEKDLDRSQLMLEHDDPDAAGFYAQQALEKYLKAYLLSKGWALKRIHDLEVLLNDALNYDPSLEEFRPLCQRATGYYMEERYPFSPEPGMTSEEIADSLTKARQLIKRLNP